MAFERRQATRITSTRHIAMLASVMKKQGTPVVLVPLTTSIHAGHRALVRAAQRIPGALVIVAIHPDVDCTPLIDARVDAIFTYTDAELWPSGPRTLVDSPLSQAAGGAGASVPVTRIMALLGIIGPTDLVQQAITDLHYPVVVHEVPTVRTSEGLPVSNRYADIPPADHDKAVAVSASLIAGTYAAQDGAAAILVAAYEVLAAAGVEPDELALYSLMLGPAPESAPEAGDARLVVSATVGGVCITDSVRVVLGAKPH